MLRSLIVRDRREIREKTLQTIQTQPIENTASYKRGLFDSRPVFTRLPLCKQLRGLLPRIHERHPPAASAPRRWRCTAPNSAAFAKCLHARLHQELPPAKTETAEHNVLFTRPVTVVETFKELPVFHNMAKDFFLFSVA